MSKPPHPMPERPFMLIARILRELGRLITGL
jgi:hypothetical protein